jgi:hypothetical protein
LYSLEDQACIVLAAFDEEALLRAYANKKA